MGRPGARIELTVTFEAGRRHLPVVTLDAWPETSADSLATARLDRGAPSGRTSDAKEPCFASPTP